MTFSPRATNSWASAGVGFTCPCAGRIRINALAIRSDCRNTEPKLAAERSAWAIAVSCAITATDAGIAVPGAVIEVKIAQPSIARAGETGARRRARAVAEAVLARGTACDAVTIGGASRTHA